jgi:hypothetical protein
VLIENHLILKNMKDIRYKILIIIACLLSPTSCICHYYYMPVDSQPDDYGFERSGFSFTVSKWGTPVEKGEEYSITVGIWANDDSVVIIKNMDVTVIVHQQDLDFSNMHAFANVRASNQVKSFVNLPDEYKITYCPIDYSSNGIAPISYVFDFNCTDKHIKKLTLKYLIELEDRTITDEIELKSKKSCYFSVH